MMKDTQETNLSSRSNPNLQAFNAKVRDLGIDPDNDSLNLNYLHKAYIEGFVPDAEKLSPSA